MNKKLTILCGTALWLAATGSGHADTVYSSGVNDITTAVSGIIDLEGGVLNIDVGGSVTGSATDPNGEAIDVTDGTLNIYGDVAGASSGTFAPGIQMSGGTVNIYSGSVAGGTSVNSIYTFGIQAQGGTLNIFGGNISGGAGTYGEGIDTETAQVNMSGGTVQGGTGIYGEGIDADTTQVNISSGIIQAGTGTFEFGIELTESELNLQGGTVTGGSNGPFNEDLDAESGSDNVPSTANIYGQNYSAPLGPLAGNFGNVTGTLADGTALNLNYRQFPDSEIVLLPVPEPSSIALAGLGVAALFLGRRQK